MNRFFKILWTAGNVLLVLDVATSLKKKYDEWRSAKKPVDVSAEPIDETKPLTDA